MKQILKGSLVSYKYSIISNYLGYRKQKILKIRKIRAKREEKRYRKAQARLRTKKEYRPYFHKFKVAKYNNKEKSDF